MNPWKVFESILPKEPLLVALVINHDGIDRSRVQLPTGGQILVIGQQVPAGSWAYIRGGKIEAQAPTLTVAEVTV